MKINELIKQIKFPFKGYYEGINDKGIHVEYIKRIKNWNDVYQDFNISPENTIMDVDPISNNYMTKILIGTPYDMFLFKEEDNKNFTVVIKQSIRMIEKPLPNESSLRIQHVEKQYIEI